MSVLESDTTTEETVDNAVENQDTGSRSSSQPQSASFWTEDGKLDGDKFLESYGKYDPSVDKESAKKFLETNGYDLNKVFKQSLNLNRLLGKEKIPLPGKDATPEQVAEIYQKLGAPGPDGKYAITDAQKEGFDENALNGILDVGKKINLTQSQMDALLPIMAEGFKAQAVDQPDQAEVQEAAIKQLEQSWGRQDSQSFRDNVTLAQKGLKILASDLGVEDTSELVAKYGNDPFLLKAFAQKAREAGENANPPGTNGADGGYAKTLDDRIHELNQQYLKTKDNRVLDQLMELRARKNRYGS